MTEQPTSEPHAEQRPSTGRPMGVTVLAVLAAIGGIFGLLAALALLGLSGVASASGIAGFGIVNALLTLVYAVLALAFAYGAWTLKPWAWPMGMAFAVLGILSNLANLIGGTADATSVVIGLAIAGVVIYYLMTPQVKAAFGRS